MQLVGHLESMQFSSPRFGVLNICSNKWVPTIVVWCRYEKLNEPAGAFPNKGHQIGWFLSGS